MIDSRTHAGVLATVFIDRTRRLASDLGIDYRPIKDTTHFLQVEEPAACVAAVEDFLKQHKLS